MAEHGRLIDADELKIDYGFTWDDITPTHDEMYALIDRQPTIEPERKTGKWELDEKSLRHRCSECLSVASLDDHGKEVLSDYCGVCGSDMRGEKHG